MNANSRYSPAFELQPGRLLVGLEREFSTEVAPATAQLWEEFAPLIGSIPSRSPGQARYGVVTTGRAKHPLFNYLAAVEVTSIDSLPPGMTAMDVPSLECAVFSYDGPVSGFGRWTLDILRNWLPSSGRQKRWDPAKPEYIEHFGPAFVAGSGNIELWIPVALRNV